MMWKIVMPCSRFDFESTTCGSKRECTMLHTITQSRRTTQIGLTVNLWIQTLGYMLYCLYIGANTNSNIAKSRDEQILLILQNKCPVCQISKPQKCQSNRFNLVSVICASCGSSNPNVWRNHVLFASFFCAITLNHGTHKTRSWRSVGLLVEVA